MAKKKINVTLIVIISVIAIGIFVTIGFLTNWFQGKKTNKDKLYNPVLEGKMSNQGLKKSVGNIVPDTYKTKKYYFSGTNAMWNMHEKNDDRVYFQNEVKGEKKCADANNKCKELKDPEGKCCTGMIPIPPLKKGDKTMRFVGVAGYNAQSVYFNDKFPDSKREQEEQKTDERKKEDTEKINNLINNNIKKSSGTLSTKKKKEKKEEETKLPTTKKNKFTLKGNYPFYRSLNICDDSSPDKKWSKCLFDNPRDAAYACDSYNKKYGESLNELDQDGNELKDVCIGFSTTKDTKYLLLGNRYISPAQTFKEGRVDE